MVIVAQLVRASDCGSEGRGFETRLSPRNQKPPVMEAFFVSLRDAHSSFLSTTSFSALLAISHTIAKPYCVLLVNASNSILETSSVAL